MPRHTALRFSLKTILLIAALVCGLFASYSAGHRDGKRDAFSEQVDSVVTSAITDRQFRHLTADAQGLTNISVERTDAQSGIITFSADVVDSAGKSVGTATGTLGAHTENSRVFVSYDEGGKSEFTPRYFASDK